MYNVQCSHLQVRSTHTKLGCGQYKVENLCFCLFIIDQLQSCEMTNNHFQHLNLILVLVQPQQERGIFGLCRGTEATKYATTASAATAPASNSPENWTWVKLTHWNQPVRSCHRSPFGCTLQLLRRKSLKIILFLRFLFQVAAFGKSVRFKTNSSTITICHLFTNRRAADCLWQLLFSEIQKWTQHLWAFPVSQFQLCEHFIWRDSPQV